MSCRIENRSCTKSIVSQDLIKRKLEAKAASEPSSYGEASVRAESHSAPPQSERILSTAAPLLFPAKPDKLGGGLTEKCALLK